MQNNISTSGKSPREHYTIELQGTAKQTMEEILAEILADQLQERRQPPPLQSTGCQTGGERS